MRERLREVHGSLAIASRPSQGTRIEVRVPLSYKGGNIIVMNLNGGESRLTPAIAAQPGPADNGNLSGMQEAAHDEPLADASGNRI
jgi:hypothetical protein